MKKYALLIFLFAITTNNIYSQYWEKVTNIPAGFNKTHYLDVFFLPDGIHGWICGFNGHVLRTTDGGNNWLASIVPGSYHLESIHFPTATTGYTSGVEGIWKSTNGGAAWTDITPDPALQYWGCYFVNENTGMVVGGGCTVPYTQYFCRTTNGGATWSMRTYTVPYSGMTDLILYSETGLGYATSSGYIWETDNGGLDWAIFESTGMDVWQEEISNVGTSFLVPYAGTSCSGGEAAGGMHFYDGSRWRTYSTGVVMYGAFMIDEETGWACGDRNAVYYTEDAGRTWELKNCGIQGAHLDDVWFIDANKGWLAGTSIYRMTPEKISVSDTELDFGTVCLPFSDTANITAVNLSCEPSGATVELLNNTDEVFSIVSPVNSPFTVAECDSSIITVRYTPKEEKDYTATLRITIRGNIFIVNLKGSSFRLSATPSDTLVDFGSVKCGSSARDTVYWTTNRQGESINQIKLAESNNSFKYMSAFPVDLDPKEPTLSVFIASPIDTGWNTARYSFRLLPCSLWMDIVLKVYGVSPIIQSDSVRNFTLNCTNNMLDTIPVSNTGNADLTVSLAYLSDGTKGFRIVGWLSKSTVPFYIKPGATDYAIVSYTPKTNDPVEVFLMINNDDKTTKYGDKNPYKIKLQGEVLSVRLDGDTLIDLGDICIDDSLSYKYRLRNLGNMISTVSAAEYDNSLITFAESGTFTINTNDSADVNFSLIPTTAGDFSSIIKFSDKSCGDSIVVRVKGRGVFSDMETTPDLITGTVQTLVDTVPKPVIAENNGMVPVTITGFAFNPDPVNWYYKLKTPLPITIDPGKKVQLDFEFAALRDTTIDTRLCLTTKALCPLDKCIDIRLQSLGNLLALEPEPVDFGLLTCPGDYTKEVIVINKSKSADTITSITLSTGTQMMLDGAYPLPHVLGAGDTMHYTVHFSASAEGTFTDTLVVTSVNSGKVRLYTVVISSEHRTPRIELSGSVHAFSAIEQCDTARQKVFTFSNRGQYGDTLIVTALNNIPGFRPQPADRLTVPPGSSAAFTVTCTPEEMAIGTNSEQYSFKSTVCDTSFTIGVSAEIYRERLTMEPAALDFGQVWVGENQARTFTIKNNSGYDKWVDSIVIDDANYSHNAPTPFLLRAGDARAFEVRFISPAQGTYNSTAQVFERSVCLDSSFVSLLAASPEEVYYTTLEFDDLTSKYSTPITFYLHFRHDDRNLSHDLTKLSVSAIDYDFKFDNFLFEPLHVYVRNNGNYTEISPVKELGRLSGRLGPEFAGSLLETSGDLMKIDGIALASVPVKTLMEIADFTPVTPKSILLNRKNGSLTVTGFCRGDVRFRLVSLAVNSIVPAFTAVNDDLELLASLERDCSVTVGIYTLTGNLVHEKELALKAGKSVNSMDCSSLSNGAYLVNISDGGLFNRNYTIVVVSGR